MEGDKLVMDVAMHTDHHRQARESMGLPRPKYVAATFTPLKPEEIKKYEDQYKVTFEHKQQKALPEFVEPEHWKVIRARGAAALAKREEKK